MKRRILAIILVCSMALSLAACSGSGKSSTEEKKNTEEEQNIEEKKEIQTIRIGTNPGTGNIFGFIAEDKGFDEEEGYKAEFINFDNSTDALNALQTDKIDVGVNFGTGAPLTFVTQGADFTIFGGYVSGGMPVYAGADFEYTGLESFVGKKVGTARMYTPDIIWRGVMMEAGYDLENDVEIMEFKKPSEVLAAVKAGQVDVGIGTNSTYLGAVESGLQIVTWTNELAPEAVCCRQVANTSWVEEHEELAVAYLKSLIRAEEVLVNDPDYAVSVFAKNMELDEESARTLLLETNQELWTDPKSNGVQAMWDSMNQLGYIDGSEIDVEDHINIDVYKKALDELIEEYPDDEYFSKTLVERYEQNNSEMLGK